jgi:hypothetical protein
MTAPSRFLGLFAALGVLSLVAFAPSSALAHAGHSHASVNAQQSQAARADAKVNTASRTVVEARMHAPSTTHHHGVDGCADRDCCGNGHCSACCNALSPAFVTEFSPPAKAPRLTFDAAMPPGLGTDGPPRPPRSFA